MAVDASAVDGGAEEALNQPASAGAVIRDAHMMFFCRSVFVATTVDTHCIYCIISHAAARHERDEEGAGDTCLILRLIRRGPAKRI